MAIFTPYSPPIEKADPKGPGHPYDDWEKVGKILDLFYRARSERRPLLDRWMSNYEMIHNRTWSQFRPAWMPSPEVAEIWPTIASIVAWQSDATPTFDVTPYADPNSDHYAEMAQKAADLRVALQASWDNNSTTGELQRALWDVNVYGTGILKAYWDSHAEQGQGDATMRRVDPFWFYPDPDATSIDDARYLIEVYELSDEALEERFPGALERVGSGGVQEIDRAPTATGTPRGSQPKANVAPIAPNTNPDFGLPGQGVSRIGQIDSLRHTVIECWYRCTCSDSQINQDRRRRAELADRASGTGLSVDDLEAFIDVFGDEPSPDAPEALSQIPDDLSGLEDTPPVDPLAAALADPTANPTASPAGDNPAPEEPQFTPTSHWHVTVISGSTILMDAPVDRIWGHGEQPYERVVAVDEGEFWGTSLTELLVPLQKSINWLASAMEHNIWLSGNPVFVEDNRSGLQRTKVTNKPGQRVTINAGSRADWIDPPQIHPQLGMQLINFYVGEIERISGLSAIVRGATPTGRNAQGVIDSVQEAAFVRIRMTLRNMEDMLRSQGRKMGALIAEFYDDPRIVAMIGPGGVETVRALAPNHFSDTTGSAPTPMRFQLKVQAGSTLSTSRAARIAEADTLYAMGAIDAEALLVAHEHPNWPTIVARMREMQAAQGGPIDPGPSARTAAGRTH